MLAIGLMSGTSLDGVDISLVEITKNENNEYNYEEIENSFYPYHNDLKNRIIEASRLDTSNVQKICSLNVELGYVYTKAINEFISKKEIQINDIAFIAMHGQTVWHNPNQMDNYYSSTLQIGDPSIIAYNLNIEVISNFRMMDMASNGCGAPLVPFVNYLLNKSDSQNIAFQNIGGIGNVTYIPKNATSKDIIAFDTGPGNLLIDQAMQILYNLPYDDGGKIAKRGKVNNEVLKQLMEDEYIKKTFPKSTGREKYSHVYVSKIIEMMKSNIKEDIIATITAYTADSIIYAANRFYPDLDVLILSGGGAYNDFIVERLKNNMNCKIKTYKKSDSYEAFCFAVMGHRTYLNLPSNLPCVTGASEEVILGNITYPPRKKD